MAGNDTDIATYLNSLGADNLMKYAGVPDGIPKRIQDKYWGYLNKNSAFANWSDVDEICMEEDLKVIELKELMSHTENELIDCDEDIPDINQVIQVTKGLMSLGKYGFLLKQAKTNNTNYSMQNGESKTGNKFLDFMKPSEDM